MLENFWPQRFKILIRKDSQGQIFFCGYYFKWWYLFDHISSSLLRIRLKWVMMGVLKGSNFTRATKIWSFTSLIALIWCLCVWILMIVSNDLIVYNNKLITLFWSTKDALIDSFVPPQFNWLNVTLLSI